MKGRICQSKYSVGQMKWLYDSWTLDNSDSITEKRSLPSVTAQEKGHYV